MPVPGLPGLLATPLQGGGLFLAPQAIAVDRLWQPRLEPACKLKDALDHSLRWADPGPGDSALASTLQANGIDLREARNLAGGAAFKFSMPDRFAAALLGSWFGHGDAQQVRGWVSVPPWTTFGWVRKDSYRATLTAPAAALDAKIDALDARLAASAAKGNYDEELATTYAIEGIPIFWAGEGKNRTQLYRLRQQPRVTELIVYPPVTGFERVRLRPVAGFAGLAALQYASGKLDVLAFAERSQALLEPLGVQTVSKASAAAGWQVMRELVARFGFRQALRVRRSLSPTRLALITEGRADDSR